MCVCVRVCVRACKSILYNTSIPHFHLYVQKGMCLSSFIQPPCSPVAPLPTTPQLTGGEGNVVIRIIPEPGIPLYRCIYRMDGSMNITERNASDVDNWMVDLPPGTYTVQVRVPMCIALYVRR